MDYKNYIQLTLNQGINFSIGKAISDGFNLLGKNIGAYVGFTIVSFFITIAASLFAMFVPFIGSVAVGVLVSPALLMGFAIFARKTMINENPTFDNFFDAFKINYGQLVIVNLILQLIQFALMALVLTPILGEAMAVVQDFSALSDPDLLDEFLEEFMLSIAQYWWVFALYIVVSLVIQLLYMLANYFVIFYGFGFWEAMETSRQLMAKVFFEVLILYILVGALVAIGTLVTLFIGILFLFPFSILVNFSVFNQVAGFAENEHIGDDELIE